MVHQVRVERYGLRLRPVRLEDAPFIVHLRNSPHALPFVGDSATDVFGQERWIKQYLERANDWYFILETSGRAQAIGTVGVYDVQGAAGEWGRWIALPGFGAGWGSAWLAFHVCFDVLRLEVVVGHVLETNSRVLSLYQRMGYPRVGVSPTPIIIRGTTVNRVVFRATRSDWARISANLDRYAKAAASRLANRGDKGPASAVNSGGRRGSGPSTTPPF
jgi:RimJ/RimL family protein N-acetyltransferase